MHQRIDNTFEFGRFLVRRFMADQGPQSAAALTYTTLFAVVPMMTVTFAMLSAIPAFKGVGEQIQFYIFNNFIPSTGATASHSVDTAGTVRRRASRPAISTPRAICRAISEVAP